MRFTALSVLLGILPALTMGQSMSDVVRNYVEDLGSVDRRYWVGPAASRFQERSALFASWEKRLGEMDYAKFDVEDRLDWHLLRLRIERDRESLREDRLRREATRFLLPFADTIIGLVEKRRNVIRPDYQVDAGAVDALSKAVTRAQTDLDGVKAPSRVIANRAARHVDELRDLLKEWHDFFAGYDPEFSWWMTKPYQSADVALGAYAAAIREKLVGIKPDDKTTIIGDPIGREALLEALEAELIPYTPEELFQIAEKEFEWCERELKRAAKDLGYGDDTKGAMEHVKKLHVKPGDQPYMIKELAEEAIAFLESRDLVTIPELCKSTWRMDMMSPERQLVSPFFLGGESIIVSFPTDTMTHEQKLMSMRGNNRHFSRATVQHELIPGHHLQGFMEARYRPYRQAFHTPFWIEGWALYWEFRLWDLGFPKSPEDRIGMLFWRMHRCARILFSLGFHLGKMTPDECVTLLVDRVGHERENAVAEVRRSFAGDYPPLYQAAYMLGGLQIRSMHKELVSSGKMTDKQFHDAILQGGPIPIALVRARLTQTKLPKSLKPDWRFYGN